MSFTDYDFPNTRMYESDLREILAQMKRLKEIVETFVTVEQVRFADPILWDIATQYSKNTIVLSVSGDAYLSKQAVPAGVQLNNEEYWQEIFNFADYVRTANENLTINIEQNTTRSEHAYNVDDWLLWNDVLYKVIAEIEVDDLLVVDSNVEHFTVEDFIKAWIRWANAIIQQYKDDIDASELQYRNQLAQDIANTTASLQAQLDLAIAGATVDSEVINARLGADGVTYATLGEAIRTQFTNQQRIIDDISETTKNIWYGGDLQFLKLHDTGTTLNIPAGTYTLSAIISTDSTNTSARFVLYLDDSTSQSVAINVNRGNVRTSASFTVSDKIVRIVFYANTVNGSDGITATWNDIQVEESSSATDYVPPYNAVDRVARADTEHIKNFVGVTRNLWTLGDKENISPFFDTRVGGVDFPAGDYVFSCMMDTETTSSRVYFYFDDNTNDYIAFNTENYRQCRAISFPDRCNRIVIYSGINIATSTGNTANYTDIQLEENNCFGYRYSNSSLWAPVAYPTPYIAPESAYDYIAEQLGASNWKGKTANFVGDSITQGVGSIQRVGYVPVAQSIIQFGKINNYAIGGTRLAHVEGETDCLIDRYTDMTADCDLFFLMANTNDYASQVPIGDPDSVDTSTYNGALNVLFSWLKSTYLTQPVIISTMLTRKVNYIHGEPLPITIDQYAQAVRDRCADYGFILYDAYKCGIDIKNSPTDGTGVSDDNLHPNRAGALSLGRKVAAFINAQ